VNYQRRRKVFEHAAQTSVTEACKVVGVSRTTYYEKCVSSIFAKLGLPTTRGESRRVH
jgi:ACT domain-containing protein